jgi:hypothetical protein
LVVVGVGLGEVLLVGLLLMNVVSKMAITSRPRMDPISTLFFLIISQNSSMFDVRIIIT